MRQTRSAQKIWNPIDLHTDPRVEHVQMKDRENLNKLHSVYLRVDHAFPHDNQHNEYAAKFFLAHADELYVASTCLRKSTSCVSPSYGKLCFRQSTIHSSINSESLEKFKKYLSCAFLLLLNDCTSSCEPRNICRTHPYFC